MKVTLFAVLVWLVLPGCRDAAYSAASKRGTIEGWRSFLLANPGDENVEAARENLAELEFAQAQQVHSFIAYKRFLEEFPDSGRASAARALLEALRFNAAREKATTIALRGFLKEHPDGAHRAEAEAQLRQLELRELATLDDPRELARLVDRHADAPQAEAATDRIDELSWARAASAAATYAYLRDFPAGKHRDDARARLASLELDSALASGDLPRARVLVARSPVAQALPDLKARLARAEAAAGLEGSPYELVRSALPSYSLRPFDEVVRSLRAPDPMARWQAADELGFTGSARAISPLLETLRTGRPPITRQRSVDALARVLKTLPPAVADYEVATRLEALGGLATDTQLVLTSAVLLDLSGQLERAATEYQRAFDPANPDPVVLRRWAAIRLERRQFFSAAVAARQLGVHAATTAADMAPPTLQNALLTSRELCSAADELQFALSVLEGVAKQKTEFPDDVNAFLLRAREQQRLVAARLRDAEVELLTVDPGARRCGDEEVLERMREGEMRRLEALGALRVKRSPALPLLLQVLRERDPSPLVRAEAAKP